MEPCYATREAVMAAMDTPEPARAAAQVDRAVQAASRAVDGLCKRLFYPRVQTIRFDWPNRQTAEAWRVWFYANDLYRLDALTAGGVAIPTGDVILEPNWAGPPYTSLQTSLATSSALQAGATWQQAIAVTGLWGYMTSTTTAATTVGTTTTGAGTVTVTGTPGIGVGSTLQLDQELVIVTGRQYTSAGALTGAVAASSSVTLLPLASTTGWSAGDWALVDAERCRVDDVTPTGLIVRRASDGTTLAAHSSGATVYAPWVLVVQRASLGSTAASHPAGTAVVSWRAPSQVEEYVVAHALNEVLDERSGFARAYSGGSGGTAVPVSRRSLESLERDLYTNYGRQARTRVV